MPDVATLRLKPFSIKLTLRRVASFYQELRSAKLVEAVPGGSDLAAAPHLKHILAEFKDVHGRMETVLFDEMARLSADAECAVNDYVRTRYGFGPGDNIQLADPRMGPVKLRVNKVFLQSASDSDIRVDASFMQPSGEAGSRWDLYMKSPGEFQLDRTTRREMVS
jgi:hypothetical protein